MSGEIKRDIKVEISAGENVFNIVWEESKFYCDANGLSFTPILIYVKGSFKTFAKFSEKLTFLTPCNRGKKC